MSEVERITPEEAKEKVRDGKAMLVCAYDDDNKFRMVRLEDAISLGAFRLKLDSLPKNQESIFYCA